MDSDKNDFPGYEDLSEYDRVWGNKDRQHPGIWSQFSDKNFPGSGREIVLIFNRKRQASMLYYLVKWVS
jgi:hypothetical protein